MDTTAEVRLPGGSPPEARSLTGFAQYRRLTVELAISQFKLRYTQSVLGYLWSLLKPAMLFGVTYVIFVDLFKINDNTDYYGIQLLLGIVIWTFFSESTAGAMHAVAGSASLIRKAYFPRSILVIAASLTSLFTFLINLALVIVIAAALRQIQFGWQFLVALPLLVELYLFVLGLAFFLASIFVRYHDVGHLWDVLVQILFYGSGVMFSLTYVLQRAGLAVSPGGKTASLVHYVWAVMVIAANPIMQIIEDLRHALINTQAPWTVAVVTGHLAAVKQVHPLNAAWEAPLPFLIVIVVFIGGLLTFQARSGNFAQDL